ncbi:hypothetical protein [Variovorax sp. KK3]|uniref:hypothetical protein n=1 Tax=Variovorax sp. KK3 TaxID=1855728 RepID=UPI001180AF7F|nr:hypothetical protein [Variovorax sp. KK3]
MKRIFAEQQDIAQAMSQLALSGRAVPTDAQFLALMTKQWGLVQQIAALSTQLMIGIIAPIK